MLFLVPYVAGIMLMLAFQLWVSHRHKQYFKFILYMILVVSGAYGFAKFLLDGHGYIYTILMSIGMALFAAYITRTSLLDKPSSTQ